MADHDVIVVGAGLSGLRCADLVAGAGRDVLVIEGRDRVGGRVVSHRFDDGQWCERGAEFVDSAHDEVRALVRRFGLSTSAVTSGRDDDARWLDAAGRPLPFSAHPSLAADVARWDDALDRLADDVDVDDPVGGIEALPLDARSLDELIHELGLSVMARVAVGRAVRTEYMIGPNEVSLLMAAWMTALHRRSGNGFEAMRVVGGNDQLATRLAGSVAERPGASLRLGCPVAVVDAEAGAVTLSTGERITAGHLVVTVPLPVLGRIWTDIPAELSSVGYGIGGKISFHVGRRVWRDHGCDGSVRTERSWGEVWETSDEQPGDGGVLTALLSSHDGAAMLSLPGTVDRIIAEMDRLFPGFAGLVDERVVSDWTSDAFSLGAYATFGPGQLVRAWPKLRERYGRMLLAGEHTDEWAGYMEGALRSGARVAREILGT